MQSGVLLNSWIRWSGSKNFPLFRLIRAKTRENTYPFNVRGQENLEKWGKFERFLYKSKVVEKEKISDVPEKTYKYYLLYIYTQNKKGEWKFRTSLYRGNIQDSIDEEALYNIVMIGHLDFQYKPFTIKLANRNAIKYRKA